MGPGWIELFLERPIRHSLFFFPFCHSTVDVLQTSLLISYKLTLQSSPAAELVSPASGHFCRQFYFALN